MSADTEDVLDDASIEDPWRRMERLGGALEIVALKQDPQQVTRARQLLESLEQRVQEGTDGRDGE